MKHYNTELVCTDRAEFPERENYVNSIQNYLENCFLGKDNAREEYLKNTSLEDRRKEFVSMHGFPLTEYEKVKRNDFSFQKVYYYSNEYADYYRVVFKPFGEVEHYGILMLPKGFDENKTYPLVIFNHGANDGPEMVGSLFGFSFNYNHCAIRFLERGCVVFAPQMLTWNPETGYKAHYNRGQYDTLLRQLGGSFTAFELLIVKRLLDYFYTQKYIDESRIGYAGVSWGGMYALHAGAADKRIKAVLSSCFFSDRKQFNWSDWAYKNQANTFFDSEVAMLILPRFLAIECGKEDPLFTQKYSEGEFQRLREYVCAIGYEDRLLFNMFDGEHEYNPEDDTLDWFLTKLLYEE